MRARRITGLAGAAWFLASSSGAAYAQQRSSPCNAAPGAPISFVSLPGHPFSAVSSPDGCWLFVSITSSHPKSQNGVAVLRRARGEISLVRVIQVEAEPTGMTLTRDGKLLIVADGDYVVFLDSGRMISGKGDPILGYIKDGESPGSVYVNTTADDNILFVSDENAEAITVINLREARAGGISVAAIVGRIPVGRAPIALTFSPDQRWLYTTSQVALESFGWPIECKPEGADPKTASPRYPQGAILVVDVMKAKADPAHAVVARVPAGCSPVRLAITPDGERVFVTARNNNALLAFDAQKLRSDAAHARIGTVPVGSSPVGLAVVQEGKHIILTNSNRFARDQTARQTLTVIDASRVSEGTPAIVGSIPAGIFPRELGQSPDRQTLFVSNFTSNELEIIDLRRVPAPQ